MGEKIDELRVALAGTVQVDSHKRTSKSGKVFDVEAYTRSLGHMNLSQLQGELANARKRNDRTRSSQVVNELRRRGVSSEPKGFVGKLKEKVKGPDYTGALADVTRAKSEQARINNSREDFASRNPLSDSEKSALQAVPAGTKIKDDFNDEYERAAGGGWVNKDGDFAAGDTLKQLAKNAPKKKSGA